MFKSIWAFLKGKKTVLGAAGLFLTFGAEGMGWIPPEVGSWLKGAFGGLTGIGIADRVKRYGE